MTSSNPRTLINLCPFRDRLSQAIDFSYPTLFNRSFTGGRGYKFNETRYNAGHIFLDIKTMQLDYTFQCLSAMPREEREELSLRMVHRLVPEDYLSEIFTFDTEETESEEKLQEAQLDAMLRLNAIALSQLPALFQDSENAAQNILRMQRLVLWHFYAISFRLEQAIALEVHCNHVEVILKQSPENTLEWVTTLTDLLRQYAKIAQ